MNGEPLVFHNCILFEHDITNKRGNNRVPAFKKNWSPMTSNTNVPFENEYRAKQYQHPGLENKLKWHIYFFINNTIYCNVLAKLLQ